MPTERLLPIRSGWLTMLLVGLSLGVGAQASEEDSATALAAALKRALPGSGTPYADLSWQLSTGAGMVSVQLRDPTSHRLLLWGHVFRHDGDQDKLASTFTDRCADHPAKRRHDAWVWILAGRAEVRLVATSARFESDTALDNLASAFNWGVLDRL